MVDKLTQQITDALSKAAATPGGLPLYVVKSDPGLFPNTAGAKPAAQKCVTDGLVNAVGIDTKGKSPRDLYGLTDAGWEFLLAQVNPKQVLEDFVRVLEARQGEVGELLDTARRIADNLQGLKDAVARVLPGVSAGKINRPNPAAPFPKREGGESTGGIGEGTFRSRLNGETAILDAPPATELAPRILARLADWSGTAGEDCPLPELFRALSICDAPPTIGAFHDCLRKLHADGEVYLHPWTGPLYALPEPALALMAGHNVAYYASSRSKDSGFRIQDSDGDRASG